MTLRARLTVAFLVVVLGPVLLGAVFVGGTVTAVSQDRSSYRLDVAAGATRTAVNALCQRLQSAAEAVARQPADSREQLATDLVAQGQASAVQLQAGDGETVLASGAAPPGPWAECAAPDPAATHRYRAIAAQVPVQDPDGAPAGRAWALQRLDAALLDRLTEAAGVQVQPLSADGVATAAAGSLTPGAVVRSEDGWWVRRVDPAEGQPVPLVLATPGADTQGLYALLFTTVVLAALAAVGLAWWLARSTTRPLTELAQAADRGADGDLTARVPVRGSDETARLAAAFNRMTQRTSSYVQALTASRDQLRSHLAVLGDTLSSTHDLDRILRVILQTALAATGARAGAVVLLDAGGETLSGHIAESGGQEGESGGGEAGSATLTLPLAGSLLGATVAKGEARRGRVDPEGAGLHPDEPVCETYVAAPISAPGRLGEAPPWPTPPAVRGALVLYDRAGGDEFDDTDLVTLRTFAGQAAVAVDNVRTHEEAQRLSMTDPLTGLWNYRYLKDAVRREVERANRFHHTLTVLALDLDRFKEVNDVYGHPAGDAVLAEFARRIRSQIREVDLPFRQGGEEFVVLLPETDARGGVTVAQRLGAAVRDRSITITPRATTDEMPIDVTVSIGIAVYPDHGLTPHAVLDAADDALYAAKAAGRDTHRVATVAPEPVAAAELPVRTGASTPEGDLPRAGDGAIPPAGGAKPPRQSRGR